jgi:hypothetical protein
VTADDYDVVGASRDQGALLAAVGWAGDLAEASTAGLLVRRKIVGQWLYAGSSTALDNAVEVVEARAIESLHEWLVGTIPYLRHAVAGRSARPRVTYRGSELILRELVRQRRLGAIGLLTNGYEPYLGLYAPDDEDEVSTQVAAMHRQLRERGIVRPADLPPPRRSRAATAWRSLIVRHGEFLGEGRLNDGALVGWNMDVT